MKKTDNHYINEKIELRKFCIENTKSPKILECYAGKGILYNKLKHLKFKILSIEKEKNKHKTGLTGDNIKFIQNFDLTNFNIIDLDAYGTPFELLEIILNSKFKGYVIVTYIQTMFGCLPNKMLNKLGYSNEMIKKIPTIFYQNALDKLKNYLSLYSVSEIVGYFINNKNYFYFKIN